MNASFVGLGHQVLPSLLPSKNDRFYWRGRWTRFAGRLLQRINHQRWPRFVTAFCPSSRSADGQIEQPVGRLEPRRLRPELLDPGPLAFASYALNTGKALTSPLKQAPDLVDEAQ